MQIEPAAVALLAALLLLGLCLRAPITVPLFASLPFGATAVVSLGGASVMLYTPLAAMFIAYALMQPGAQARLRQLLAERWEAAAVAFLIVYVVAGAILLPRLLEGLTTVFVPGFGKIMELPLTPVPGNINQTCYFINDALCFFAVGLLALRPGYFHTIKVALFAFATVHIGLCLIDLAGKAVGAGDVLAVFRTAGYSMLVEVKAEGFWRIVGGYPEASTCAMTSATGFAFMFSYWRASGSRWALCLGLILLLLLVFSTSTTGYAVLAALSLAYFVGVAREAARGRMSSRDLWAISASTGALVVLMALVVVNGHVLNSVTALFESTILEKSASSSAVERAYWNYKSFLSFLDTGGLGVGLGSSRASSWLFAVLSQLGVVGSVLVGVLAVQLLRNPVGRCLPGADRESVATCKAVRAAGFAVLVGLLTAGGNADPGLLFFIAVAVVIAGRAQLSTSASNARRQASVFPLRPYPIGI